MIRLGTTPELPSAPLFYGITESGISEDFTVSAQSLEKNCQDLLVDQLDVALISPLSYARHSSELMVFRDLAVFTGGASKYALLFFRENLPQLRSVALFAPDSQYALLIRLALREFFEMRPDWKICSEPDSVENLLSRFPACFLEGELAMDNYLKHENHLDATEEWFENTGLPYVHQLVAARRSLEKSDFLDALLLSRELGSRNRMTIAKQYAAGRDLSWDFYFDLINETFQFFPAALIWESLGEYFQYLFFHGFINFLPEIHYY